LAASLALRAGRRRRAGRRAAAVTRLARLTARNLDAGLGAARGFLERDFEVVAQVGAALRSPAGAGAAEDVAHAEDVAETAEGVCEAGEDGGIEAGAGCRSEPGMTEAVVHPPLVGIGQHRIRLGRFLELFLGFLAAGIAVGVV